MPEPTLVDEQVAAYVTGRPASTIRRWATEGRLTRHGVAARRVRYDLLELPAATRNEAGHLLAPGATPPVLPASQGNGSVAA